MQQPVRVPTPGSADPRGRTTEGRMEEGLRFFVVVMFGIEVASIVPFLRTFHGAAFAMDLANFWAAGATVGTRALADPASHTAWQIAHHLRPQLFVYLPGFAWLYVPLSRLPVLWAFAVNDLIMAAFVFVIVGQAARIYNLGWVTVLIIVMAWYPVFYTIELGQNTLIALT